MHRLHTILLALASLAALPGAWAQTDPAPTAPAPLPKDCITEARKIIDQAHAFHDGAHKSGLPDVRGEELSRVHALGEERGSLGGISLITPPSRFQLVVLPGPASPEAQPDCPLHRTYLRFTQGGFQPQPPRYFGPLRSRAL